MDEKKDIYENQSQWVCIRFGLHLKRGITLTMVVCDCNNIPWHFVNIMVTRYVEIMCMFRNNFEKSKIFYLRKKLINQSDYNTEVFNGTKCRKSDLFALQLLYRSVPLPVSLAYMYFWLGPKVSNNEYLVILIQWNIFPLPQCKQIWGVGGGGVEGG